MLLDVKVGTGAFMTDLDQARQLGQTMTQLGEAHGVRTAAMLTAMDTPLGRAVGNAVEVQEALDVLGGAAPATCGTGSDARNRHRVARRGGPLPGRPSGRDGLMAPGSRAVTPWRNGVGGRRSHLPGQVR